MNKGGTKNVNQRKQRSDGYGDEGVSDERDVKNKDGRNKGDGRRNNDNGRSNDGSRNKEVVGIGMGTMKTGGTGMGNEAELLEAFGRHKRRCSQDFEYFCAHELLVDRKGGGDPVPFHFNRAQKYVWARLNDQWAREGMIERIS
ncbi:MAG: hypothetical protein LBE98_03535 [Puniceicoccales bacterium]|nr:hypothetical protein [Puniceicoccales bacterium]